MRVFVLAVAAVALLATAAYAEGRGKGSRKAQPAQQTEEQKKKAAAEEKAYRDALDKIPDKKYDPWATMR
jgi:hypothetical protein